MTEAPIKDDGFIQRGFKNGKPVWTRRARRAPELEGSRQARFTFVGNKKDRDKAWAKWLMELDEKKPDKRNVSDLLDEWLAAVKPTVDAGTYEGYERIVGQRLKPELGPKRLNRLTPTHIREAMDAWRKVRLDKKKGTPSERTIASYRLVGQMALAWAVDQDYLRANPFDKVARPKWEQREVTILDSDQARAMLDALEGSEHHLPALLALSCGLRRSEVLGLTWAEVNVTTGRLSVRRAATMLAGQVRIKSPKTKGSARTLVIPAFALTVLKSVRVKRIEEGLARGQQLDLALPVCLRDDGSPWKPHDLSREFARALKGRKLPHVGFHSLRHSFATFSLQAGTDLKHTSMALGHADVSITGRIYAHLVEAVQEDAAVRLDNLLGRPKDGDCAQDVPNSGSAS